MAEEVKGAEGQLDLSAQLDAERQARQAAEERAAIAEVKANNWEVVGMKRKGKLEGDENFFGEDKDVDDVKKMIDGKVAQTQRELEIARQIESEKQLRIKAEGKLSEVLRAQDNKPAGAVGASSGGGQKVEDGVFSETQIASLENKWTRMGFNEEQKKRMLETEKKNALARRAL